MQRVKDRLACVMGVLRRILRSDWGLSRRAVRTIYNGLFVPCAIYGASVWCGLIETGYGRSAVLACQRVGLLACVQNGVN